MSLPGGRKRHHGRSSKAPVAPPEDAILRGRRQAALWSCRPHPSRRVVIVAMRRLLSLTLAATATLVNAQDLPRGQIVDSVKCTADPSQTYVLYLPSNYNAAKRWNLILAFDPGGRGRRPVERYQAAAEKYGYIIAGSNNSRNGPWDISRAAAQAMWSDVLHRFNIDPRRIYAAGHSGGARVAMSIAVDYGHEVKYPGKIAGVFASSAFYPDDQPLASLAFPVFGTAGTEDFNNLEMH
jgi:poly(3-hydroxybutyrate) depolymerase